MNDLRKKLARFGVAEEVTLINGRFLTRQESLKFVSG